jgi:hypothetical protein
MVASQSIRIPSQTSLLVAIEDCVCVKARARDTRLDVLMSLSLHAGVKARTLNQDAAGATGDRHAHEAADDSVVEFTRSMACHANPVAGIIQRHSVERRPRRGRSGVGIAAPARCF